MNNVEKPTRSGLVVVALCFLTIVADGYDLIVYGASLPALLDDAEWALSKSMAGLIASWTLVGLMVGFLAAGPLADRYGCRKVVLAGGTWFSIGSLICAFAPSPEVFGLLRFLTGIGLGFVVPCAVTLTVEYAPAARRQLYNGIMMTGYCFGGILAALVAIWLLPHHSWRWLFGLAVTFLIILPVMYFRLPESLGYLTGKGRIDDARKLSSLYGVSLDGIAPESAGSSTDNKDRQRGYRELLTRRFFIPTVLFVIVAFCAQLIIYGLNTWLPQLMREAGYPLGSSLTFLLVLQVGAIIGMVGGALLADRYGSATAIIPFFMIGAFSLLALSYKMELTWLLIAVAGAGLGTSGVSALVYGFIAAYFPPSCRGSAVGAAMGLGRFGAILGPMMGAWILSSNLDYRWNFYGFAIPAFIAALLIGVIWRRTVTKVPASETMVDLDPADSAPAESR